MKRSATFFVSLLVSLLVAAVVVPLPSNAATKSGRKTKVAQKAQRKLGCELLKDRPSSNAVCVKTAVEAWYYKVASDLGVSPITGAPAVSPYSEETLHVGVSAGKEDSRTYLTLNQDSLPFGVTVTGGTLVLPLEQAESSGAEEADIKVCYVPEPPDKSEQGSLDTPPKTDCSEFSNAVYRKKPRPLFTVDLAPFSTLFEGGVGGIALVPTGTAQQEGATWHVALYTRKNRIKDAVAIAALLEYVKIDLDLPPPGISQEDMGAVPGPGSDFQPPASGSSGFPIGGPVDIGEPAPPVAPEVPEPVAVGSDVAAPTVALAPRYSAIWYLPLALLVGAGFLGFVLTRKIEVSP